MRKQLEGLNKEYRKDLIKAHDTLVNLANKTKDILTPEVKQGVLYSEEQLYANLVIANTLEAINCLGGLLEQLENSVEENVNLVKDEMELDPKELNRKCQQKIVHETMPHMQPEEKALLETIAMFKSL